MPTRGERLRVAAALLAAPDDDALVAIDELRDEYDWLAAPLAELAATPLGHWQAEHARLFISGHPRTVAPPYASAWRDGQMPGPTTERVTEFFQRAGLRAVQPPADYLGAMLECAAWLEEHADTAHDQLASELWREYLGDWLPRFTDALATDSRLSLYRALGEELNALHRETCNG
jgi:putative dimethyl sulfoxide reductase chaperone